MTINTLYEGIDAYNQLIITKTDEMMTESTNFSNIIDSVCLLRENNIIFEFNIKETFKAAIGKVIEFGKWLIEKIKGLVKKIFNRERIDQKIADESINVIKKNSKFEIPEDVKERLRKNLQDSVNKFDKLEESIKKEEEKSKNKEFSVVKYLDFKKDMKGISYKYSFNKTPGDTIDSVIKYIKDETEGYENEKEIKEKNPAFDKTNLRSIIEKRMNDSMTTWHIECSNNFDYGVSDIENYKRDTLDEIIAAKAEVKEILNNLTDKGVAEIVKDLEERLNRYSNYTKKEGDQDWEEEFNKEQAKVTKFKLDAYRYLLKLTGELIEDYNGMYTNLEYMREVVQHNVNIIAKCYVDPKNKA